jgi:phospholipid-binding lipoprotein MlaA
MATRAALLSLILIFPPVGVAEEETNPDPWKGVNQTTFAINETADRYVLKPVSKTYRTVLPGFARQGISHFFGNVDDVQNSVNNLLQGKPVRAVSDLGRIVINTSLGLGGLFDPASGLGLKKHNESFGQTLSVWGVPQGPYLVLPFLGPSTITDMLARPFDSALDPVRRLYPVDHRNRLLGIKRIDQRADLLAAESVVFGDRYIFLRDAYLQRRNFNVKDGEVEDEFDDF